MADSGNEPDRGTVLGDAHFELALFAQDNTEIAVRPSEIGLEPNRCAKF